MSAEAMRRFKAKAARKWALSQRPTKSNEELKLLWRDACAGKFKDLWRAKA